MKIIQGVLYFQWRPWKWRFGLERVPGENQTWLWLVFGPIALNLGEVGNGKA